MLQRGPSDGKLYRLAFDVWVGLLGQLIPAKLSQAPSVMTDEDLQQPTGRPQLATNADFRRLLETPRADRFAEADRKAKAKKQPEAQKPKRRPQRPKPEAEEKEEDGPQYR